MKKTKENDRKMIEQAMLDYVEGVYNVQPERIKRSVYEKLVKTGYYYSEEEAGYKEHRMFFDNLYKAVKTHNADGHIPSDARKEVTILCQYDQTACAELKAHWGIDLVLLAKLEGRWMITLILWQSPPRQLDN